MHGEEQISNTSRVLRLSLIALSEMKDHGLSNVH
jgi:hypothetical protein